jgi:hypothetical protein
MRFCQLYPRDRSTTSGPVELMLLNDRAEHEHRQISRPIQPIAHIVLIWVYYSTQLSRRQKRRLSWALLREAVLTDQILRWSARRAEVTQQRSSTALNIFTE